jgi:uncharacterized damage-inducible protein DinB
MVTSEKLIQSFKITTRIINRQAEGLTHEDMVLQPPFRANCFNWVLGHIVVGRDRVLALFDETPTLSEAEKARYVSGSDPVTDGDTAVPSQKLLTALDDSLARIAAVLEKATPDQLAAIYNEEYSQTVADRIAGLHWHETYHTGQLELLRQLAGTNDAIIR